MQIFRYITTGFMSKIIEQLSYAGLITLFSAVLLFGIYRAVKLTDKRKKRDGMVIASIATFILGVIATIYSQMPPTEILHM